LHEFQNILNIFSDEDMYLVAIPGNHDKSDYKSEISYLDSFKHHPGFILFDTGGSPVPGICMLPYFLELDVYEQKMKLLKTIKNDYNHSKNFNILITHVAVNGVKNNDGSKVQNEINEDLFDGFDKVLIGHYHNRSIVKDKFHYIGSAFQHNFGEDDEKGFTLVMDDGTLEFVKSDFKKFIKIEIDIDSTSKKELNDLCNQYGGNPNNNIRFVFKGEHEKLQAIDTSLFLSLGIDVKRESNELIIGVQEAENDEFVSFDKSSIKTEFEEFCIENKIKSKTGLDYLQKVL
jgi:exonuclease SbcD